MSTIPGSTDIAVKVSTMKSAGAAETPDRQFRLRRMGPRRAVADEVFHQRLYGNTAPLGPRRQGALRFLVKFRCSSSINSPYVFCILSHALLVERLMLLPVGASAAGRGLSCEPGNRAGADVVAAGDAALCLAPVAALDCIHRVGVAAPLGR